MSNQRTAYDRMMMEKFNPSRGPTGYYRESYNTPPFPGTRTEADGELQKQWCPSCPPKTTPLYAYNGGPKFVESYAPLTGFRTKFDLEMQKQWCPSCTNPGPVPNQ